MKVWKYSAFVFTLLLTCLECQYLQRGKLLYSARNVKNASLHTNYSGIVANGEEDIYHFQLGTAYPADVVRCAFGGVCLNVKYNILNIIVQVRIELSSLNVTP